MGVTSNVKKTIAYLRRNGIENTYYAARERLETNRRHHYAYAAPGREEMDRQRIDGRNLTDAPVIAVVMPAYNTPESFLREAVESVVAQSYEHWRLIVSDASDTDAVRNVMQDYLSDERIKYLKLTENGGISANTNAGIALALQNDGGADDGGAGDGNVNDGGADDGRRTCDYVGLLDHDDVLTPDALYHMAMAIIGEARHEMERIGLHQYDEPDAGIGQRPADGPKRAKTDKGIGGAGPALLYSDEDKMHRDEDSGAAMYFDDHIKYKFNYDLILTNNYICHFMLIRRDVAAKIKFRPEFDGAQDYDYVLQVIRMLCGEECRNGISIDRLGEEIVHVPRVLYHWRSHPGSTATNAASKDYAYEAGLRALEQHVSIMHGRDAGAVRHGKHRGFYEIIWGHAAKNDEAGHAAKNDEAGHAAENDEAGHATENDEAGRGARGAGAGRIYVRDLNDVFEARPDVGAVIGRNYDRHGVMIECIADEDGNWLYAGTFKHYAGRFNRFDCAQDVAFADVRFVRTRQELQDLLDEARNEDYVASSRRFAAELKARGYQILYVPYEI